MLDTFSCRLFQLPIINKSNAPFCVPKYQRLVTVNPHAPCVFHDKFKQHFNYPLEPTVTDIIKIIT